MFQERKLEEQGRLEEYLEENHVFEIFEDMMKSLILKRPDDPIKFLLEKIKSPPGKLSIANRFQIVQRFIIVGPPGSKSKEIANQLGDVISDQGRFVSFSVDDLLNKEIKKKSEIGQKIL